MIAVETSAGGETSWGGEPGSGREIRSGGEADRGGGKGPDAKAAAVGAVGATGPRSTRYPFSMASRYAALRASDTMLTPEMEILSFECAGSTSGTAEYRLIPVSGRPRTASSTAVRLRYTSLSRPGPPAMAHTMKPLWLGREGGTSLASTLFGPNSTKIRNPSWYIARTCGAKLTGLISCSVRIRRFSSRSSP